MNVRHAIYQWTQRGAVTDARAALEVAGVFPAARDWRRFLDALLLWSGVVALAAAVVFFIAYNWSALGRHAKFGLVEALMLAAVAGYWWFRPERAAGKSALLAAAVLLGVLLALFGQTYQTGADAWQLFANWVLLMLPWVLIAQFAALWVLWLALANVAVMLYFDVSPSVFGVVFGTERQLWTLFVLNTWALALWELSARRLPWLDERWAPRLLAVASGTTVTLLVLHAIFEWKRQSGIVLIVYPLWLAGAYAAYRVARRDLLVLAGGCLSVIAVVTGFLAKNLLGGRGEAGSFLFIALTVAGMAAASAWWLKETAREDEA